HRLLLSSTPARVGSLLPGPCLRSDRVRRSSSRKSFAHGHFGCPRPAISWLQDDVGGLRPDLMPALVTVRAEKHFALLVGVSKAKRCSDEQMTRVDLRIDCRFENGAVVGNWNYGLSRSRHQSPPCADRARFSREPSWQRHFSTP